MGPLKSDLFSVKIVLRNDYWQLRIKSFLVVSVKWRYSKLSLIHEFRIVNQERNTFDSNFEPVSISDTLILYMRDSLNWINFSWNGKEKKNGLNYYGETIIKENSIDKLRDVVHAWIKLFELATDEFILTGNYLLDENKYEKISVNKKEVLLQLKSLYFLCEKAIEQNKDILHSGI